MTRFAPPSPQMTLRVVILAVALLLPSFVAQQAEATVYAVQVGATKPLLDDGKTSKGYGVDIAGRIGFQVPIPLFDLEVEGLLGLNTYNLDGAALTQTMRAGVGLRGGANLAFYPHGFVHVSYGRQFNAAVGSPSGALVDVGLAFDLTALPYVRIGVYGAYNHLIHSESSKVGDGDGQWLSFGVQGAFVN